MVLYVSLMTQSFTALILVRSIDYHIEVLKLS